jgi:Lsr2.
MGTKTVAIHFDDLDGETEATQMGIKFHGPNGQLLEVDLSDEHAKQLQEACDEFTEATEAFVNVARPVERSASRGRSAPRKVAAKSARPSKADGERMAAIRDWARTSGKFPNLKDRGRVGADVVAAYEAAHSSAPTAVPAAVRPTRRVRAA